ncbi:MAG: hypothetical protein ACJ79H_08740 [Myxococcales bacterium]
MDILHTDVVVRVPPGEVPEYGRQNPLLKLVGLVERTEFAADREQYLADSLQFLFPFRSLQMYGPQGNDADVLDPARQDNKTDFQKQNVHDFFTTDTELVRGIVTAGAWTGPFLRLSYRGGPDSLLSQKTDHQVGDAVLVWLSLNGVTVQQPIRAPYNERTDRYDLEIWGYPGADLRERLGSKGIAALDAGRIVARTDLIQGNASDFHRDGKDGRYMIEVEPGHGLHPVLPLAVEVAWANAAGTEWDSQDGRNYRYRFGMIVRGWENYLGVGISPNPHGGVGFLEYRNLLSNYGRYSDRAELARTLEEWNFDAFGRKDHAQAREPFMAVDYMDLHVLRGSCGIGLHRHRDNQEVFLMMRGRGLMVVGDWCKFPDRERAFEVRTLRSGHLAMLKGGNLHGLVNTTDEDISLFMFGGYD